MNHKECITKIIRIRFKTSMIRSSLCDYSDACVLFKGTITVANTSTQCEPNNGANKKLILKNYAPFTKCISRINNTQVDDANQIDVVMSMYSLIEYSKNYSKASGIFWQYFRDKPALVDDGTIADFTANNADINLFKMKEITGLAGNNGTKNVKIMIWYH